MSDSPVPEIPRPRLSFGDLRALALAGAVGVAVLAVSLVLLRGIPVDFAKSSLLVPVAAIAGVLATGMLLLRPRWLFAGLILLAMTFHQVLETTAIPLGFMKLYIHDVVFAVNMGIILLRSSVGKTRFRRIPFNTLVMVYFALGLWGAFNGLFIKSHAYDEVLGDFRRAFLYFMNYFVVLLLVDDLRETRMLRKLVLAGCAVLIAKGFFQVITGKFYYLRFGDAAHVLSHYELTFLGFAVFYGLGRLLFDPGKTRFWWVVIIGAGSLITIIGNYRASWLGFVAGLGYMFFFLPGRKKLQLALLGLIGAAFVALAVITLWDTEITEGKSTLGKELMAKANVKETTADVNVIWRFQTYEAAFEQFNAHPLLGSGLGTYLVVQIATSTGGSILSEGHNIHNSALWLLMNFGVIGIIPILLFHVYYIVTSSRYVRSTQWLEGRVTVMACAAYYVSMMVATGFENFLEHATPIIVFSTLVALTMLTIYHEPDGLEERAGTA